MDLISSSSLRCLLPPSTTAPALVQQWTLCCRHTAPLFCASHSSPAGWECLTSSISALPLEDAPGQWTWVWALLPEQIPQFTGFDLLFYSSIYSTPIKGKVFTVHQPGIHSSGGGKTLTQLILLQDRSVHSRKGPQVNYRVGKHLQKASWRRLWCLSRWAHFLTSVLGIGNRWAKPSFCSPHHCLSTLPAGGPLACRLLACSAPSVSLPVCIQPWRRLRTLS